MTVRKQHNHHWHFIPRRTVHTVREWHSMNEWIDYLQESREHASKFAQKQRTDRIAAEEKLKAIQDRLLQEEKKLGKHPALLDQYRSNLALQREFDILRSNCLTCKVKEKNKGLQKTVEWYARGYTSIWAEQATLTRANAECLQELKDTYDRINTLRSEKLQFITAPFCVYLSLTEGRTRKALHTAEKVFQGMRRTHFRIKKKLASWLPWRG